jgi:hypothetical protein
MGWVVAIVCLPIAFALVASYAVLKLAFMLLRIVFAPVTMRRR